MRLRIVAFVAFPLLACFNGVLDIDIGRYGTTHWQPIQIKIVCAYSLHKVFITVTVTVLQ